jgi:hypothetical protein
VLARAPDHLAQRRPAGGSQPLEAGDLELDGDALLGRRVDRQPAMRRDRERGAGIWRGGQCARPAGEFDRAGPQPSRIRVETQN